MAGGARQPVGRFSNPPYKRRAPSRTMRAVLTLPPLPSRRIEESASADSSTLLGMRRRKPLFARLRHVGDLKRDCGLAAVAVDLDSDGFPNAGLFKLLRQVTELMNRL